VKHMERRRGFVCFRKGICEDPTCNCTKNEVQAVNIMKLPVSKKWAFPPITPDPGSLHDISPVDKSTKIQQSR